MDRLAHSVSSLAESNAGLGYILLLPRPFLMQLRLGQSCSRTWSVRKVGNDNLLGLSTISFCRQGILWYWTQIHGAFEVPQLFPGMPGKDKALGPSTALPRALPFEGDLRLWQECYQQSH